jgi:hypothetical protein
MALLLRTLAIAICLSSLKYCHSSRLWYFVNHMPVDNSNVTKIFEIRVACNAYGGEKTRIQGFGGET